MPMTFSWPGIMDIQDVWSGQEIATRSLFCCFSFWDIGSNLLLFVPLGFFLARKISFSQKGNIVRIGICVAVSFVVSSIIEVLQNFLPRFPSIVDIIMNAIGGGLGAWLGVKLYQEIENVWIWVFRWFVNKGLLGFTWGLYMVGVGIIYLIPIGPPTTNWYPEFTFQVGNDASEDRPWLGKIFKLAIYPHALQQDDIIRKFKQGYSEQSSVFRLKGDNGEVFYDFSEGEGRIVRDKGYGNVPLDLEIAEPTKMRWMDPQGLELLGPTIITRNERAGIDYAEDLDWGSNISVELWVSPKFPQHERPATIISYWRDPDEANFLIGQIGRDVIIQNRDTKESEWGVKTVSKSVSKPLTEGIQHIVATYQSGGKQSMFVNGEKQVTEIQHERRFLFERMERLIGKWANAFLILFPMGVVSIFWVNDLLRGKQISKIMVPYWGAGIVCGMVALLPIFSLGVEVDPSFILFSMGTILLSISMGALLAQPTFRLVKNEAK